MIQQVMAEDNDGCGVACLAMILGCSYQEAKQRLFGKKPVRSHEVSLLDLNRQLKRAGFYTKCTYNWYNHPAIVPLTWPKSWGVSGHFTVWDPERPDVYVDPDGTLIPTNDKEYVIARRLSTRLREGILTAIKRMK